MEKLETVKIFGEVYSLRPTFDIVDDIGGVHGFDVYGEDGNFIAHYDIDNESKVESQIKWDFYKVGI